MANNIEAKYILAFKPTPRNKDAIYYYKPGKIDTVVINLRFKGDALMVARLISYLQADVEGKKRFSKGRMELRESCVVEELDPAADPDYTAGPLSFAWDGSLLPGGEIAYLGRAKHNSGKAARPIFNLKS
jgi:hypothetical protein